MSAKSNTNCPNYATCEDTICKYDRYDRYGDTIGTGARFATLDKEAFAIIRVAAAYRRPGNKSSYYQLRNITLSSLQIALLLLSIDMPNDIIWQADDLIPSPVGHGCKALSIGLVLEGVGGEIYTYTKTVRAT